MDPISTWLLVLVSLMTVGALWVSAQAFASRHRWGTRAVSAEPVGEGAYRSGEVVRHQRQSVPSSVVVASVLAAVWAAVTLLFFVPAGGLAALVLLDARDQVMLPALAVVLATSGIGAGILLLRCGSRLVRRHDEAQESVRWATVYGAVHHVAVWVGFMIVVLATEPSGAAASASILAVPCVLGLFVCGLLRQAAREVASIDRAQALDPALA